MAPKVIPANPRFKTKSEEHVFDVLLQELGSQDVILCNLEITDGQHGDVEVDFVLLIRNRGIAIVEVKGGNITFDGRDWIQKDAKGSREINPAGQAKKNMYSVREYLRNNWSQGQIRTDWFVCFPNSKYIDIGSPDLPERKIIDAIDLDHPLTKIYQGLDSQNMYAKPSGDAWIMAASKLFQAKSSLSADSHSVLQNNHQYIKDLTHQRIELIEQLEDNQRYYVTGPAGSGKTWMAFEQAKIWKEQGLKVAILAFNRGVVSYMQMKNRELASNYQADFINTFHEFARILGTTAGSPGKYNEKDDIYAGQLLAAALDCPIEKKFDAFIIDEAQDFMESWWQVLEKCLIDPEEGFIAAFGDDQQKVFGKRKGPGKNFARIRLKENIRNSLQIAELARPLVDESIAAKGPNSYPVEFIVCDESEALDVAEDAVEKLTDREGWKPGEIALLTTKNRHPVHAEMADKDRMAYYESLWDSEDVFYGTVGGFKGLERPVVILTIDGYHHAEDLREFLYVGITRARDRLVIVGDDAMIKIIKDGQGT